MLDIPSDETKRLSLTSFSVELWRSETTHLQSAAEAAELTGMVDAHTIDQAREMLSAITGELVQVRHLAETVGGLLNSEAHSATLALETLAGEVSASLEQLNGLT